MTTQDIDQKIQGLWMQLHSPVYHRSGGKYNNAGYDLRQEIRDLKTKKCDMLGHIRQKETAGLCTQGCGILI